MFKRLNTFPKNAMWIFYDPDEKNPEHRLDQVDIFDITYPEVIISNYNGTVIFGREEDDYNVAFSLFSEWLDTVYSIREQYPDIKAKKGKTV